MKVSLLINIINTKKISDHFNADHVNDNIRKADVFQKHSRMLSLTSDN